MNHGGEAGCAWIRSLFFAASGLAETYDIALTLLVRMLCIAYDEDNGLLPYGQLEVLHALYAQQFQKHT